MLCRETVNVQTLLDARSLVVFIELICVFELMCSAIYFRSPRQRQHRPNPKEGSLGPQLDPPGFLWHIRDMRHVEQLGANERKKVEGNRKCVPLLRRGRKTQRVQKRKEEEEKKNGGK